MPISYEHNLIFIHIPKNAGTSITRAFRMENSGHWDVEATSRHYSEEWNDYHKFCIVRNPLDRFISCYKYAKMRRSYYHVSHKGFVGERGRHPDYETLSNKSFDECIGLFFNKKLKHRGWLPQSNWVCDKNGFALDEFVKMEELPRVFKGVKVPFLNKSKSHVRRTVEERIDYFYDEDMANKIETAYADDFALFNYEKTCK